jgi:hypothetical protein
VSLLKKCKQTLAQQPCGVRAFPFGISRQFCFFSEVNLSDHIFNPLLRKGKKSKHYLGIEPSTLGVADVNANHYTIQAAIINLFLGCSSEIRALSTEWILVAVKAEIYRKFLDSTFFTR